MGRKELFFIGQVAELFHVSVGTLRHYEKLGLIKPELVDSSSGYRYYSTAQFEVLNTIRYLRTLDMPLEEIKSFLVDRQIGSIQSLLEQQKSDVLLRIKELERIRRKIESRLVQLNDALTTPLDEIQVKAYPRQSMAILSRSLSRPSLEDLEIYIRELEKNESGTAVFLGKVGVGISEAALREGLVDRYQYIFLLLDEADRYTGPTVDIAPEQCVTLRFRGSHEHAADYYHKLFRWISDHDARITSFSKEITLIDAGFTSDSHEYVTEIRIPFSIIKRKKAD